MKKKILEILADPCFHWGPETDIKQAADRLEIFIRELVKWNAGINLVAEQDGLSIIEKHIFDSLQYGRVVDPGGRVMDVGSGAGFPGLPLKAVYPDLDLVLVESRKKRANFLKHVVRQMSLQKIEVIHERAENLGGEHIERFDFVLFRAVAGLPACLALGEKFLRPGGHLIIKKEPEAIVSAREKIHESLIFKEDMAFENKAGVPSILMIFEKCST